MEPSVTAYDWPAARDGFAPGGGIPPDDPSHDPEATWGFVGVVISTEDLSGSVWRWFRDGNEWKAEKVITIPAEPADPGLLPPALKPFAAVPPLITEELVEVTV